MPFIAMMLYSFMAGNDASEGQKSVRGGSWRDRPHRATAGFRLSYAPWQKVYNVGFRVICEEQGLTLASADE